MIAIDLGSNTIRFIEFDGTVWGKSFEKIVRTAESLHQTRLIGVQAIGRIIAAIEEAKIHLDFAAHTVVAYTTAAMRMAENQTDAIDVIEAATGIRFLIIDAQKEASLTLKAVRYRLDKLGIEPSAFVMADIGGGSTELISADHESVSSISINQGIVTLSESADTSGLLSEKIAAFKERIVSDTRKIENSSLVLTAGTPTTIAAYLNGMDYDHYDPRRINGFVLTLEGCYRVYEQLLSMDEATRRRYVGVGRENLIMAGILMVTAIYEALGYTEAIIIDDGLREGIALDFFDR
ncbi:phosphatase [Sulfuricurvum sp.]|uniref:Ppx/GppA phosphatase family protein n=1 Tax=Sulfuricurvum sp. TaxID=2025608 RepID=UPI002602AF04|nr:phosphatase [Sulfuricurvum sp.]MDD4883377.1 phosphatase [Sulfuricurvum sp.]